jgi:16S rRNA (guanine527-N7)-methyltransferase
MSVAPTPPEADPGGDPMSAAPEAAALFHVEPEPAADAATLLGAAEFQARTGLSDTQLADLEAFRSLLFEWNQRMNLVGPSAETTFWGRHVLDSAQLLDHAPGALTYADLGAGAGFPGIVLACLLKGHTGARIHLVESMAKRCRFLEAVVGALNLPAEVHNVRAEDLRLKVDVVTARACAPMIRLLGYAEPYFKQGARALFLKGQDVEAELKEAAKTWRFDASLHPSLSHPQGRIVAMKRVYRV